MSATPYDKAVAGFEALLKASSVAAHSKPVRLIEDSGQHLTSGYRHTAALEAEGFLRRDETGVYLQGTAASRTSLSAFGLGRLAPVLPPVLRRLREATQHTAFCAMLSDIDVHIGPHSEGRATRQIRLRPHYRLERPRTLQKSPPTDIGLVPDGPESANRVHTLMIPIHDSAPYTAVLGFVLNPARAPDASVSEALEQASRRISP